MHGVGLLDSGPTEAMTHRPDPSVLRRLCHWGPLLALSVILVVSCAAVLDSLLWLWPLGTAGALWNLMALIGWTVLILYHYLRALVVGPGRVPTGWRPAKREDEHFLQFCSICQGFKAPRSHHCRKCNRCVMKMDHHCPWINNCCGHKNHSNFTWFLLFAPLGCIYAAVILVMTMYTQLYSRLSFEMTKMKIDMSVPQVSHVPFGISAFATSLFALGLALGTTIAVGLLFCLQMKSILRNRTSVESWIEDKAKERISYYNLQEEFVYPYDLGSRWQNLREVFRPWGASCGDGITWRVLDGCHQYNLTVEQLKQKADKQARAVVYRAVKRYSGSCLPVTAGWRAMIGIPCTEEPSLAPPPWRCHHRDTSHKPTPNPYVPFLEGNKGELMSCVEAQSQPQNGLLRFQQSTNPR
uniref:Palmitoyltransferase n=1 Tax=Eptatretus burgeri TaxID=7764 RepID=A0A8C4N334_EPTBU